MAHTVIKAEKIVSTGAVALEESLKIPALFRRKGIEEYVGAKDDTINVTVDGVLPWRTYGWRNNRATPIQFDEYSERKVALSFGDDAYSAVRLTDEQNKMDFVGGWDKLAVKQVEAVGRGLESKAVSFLTDAPYEIEVQLDEADLHKSLIKLKKIFDNLNVVGPRKLLCDDDLEVALLSDDRLNLAGSVGDALAQNAVTEATLGRRSGFDLISAGELNDMSVAMVPDAFVFLNAAPSVPESVPFGATASYNGISLRWIRDYDTDYQRDRSVFTTWPGFQLVDDSLIHVSPETNQASASLANHFVRAVKVTVGEGYTVDVANTELTTFTGIADVTVTP